MFLRETMPERLKEFRRFYKFLDTVSKFITHWLKGRRMAKTTIFERFAKSPPQTKKLMTKERGVYVCINSIYKYNVCS